MGGQTTTKYLLRGNNKPSRKSARRALPLVEAALTETIHRSIRRGLPSAQIVPSILGDHPTLTGAISLVLARKFASA